MQLRTVVYSAGATPPDDPCWLLVAPDEVGLLHRLRPAVRATGRVVLVRLEHAPAAPGAQFGIVRGRTLTWFGGLSADDVADLVVLVRGGTPEPTADALRHRVVGVASTDVSAGCASPRT